MTGRYDLINSLITLRLYGALTDYCFFAYISF